MQRVHPTSAQELQRAAVRVAGHASSRVHKVWRTAAGKESRERTRAALQNRGSGPAHTRQTHHERSGKFLQIPQTATRVKYHNVLFFLFFSKKRTPTGPEDYRRDREQKVFSFYKKVGGKLDPRIKMLEVAAEQELRQPMTVFVPPVLTLDEGLFEKLERPNK